MRALSIIKLGSKYGLSFLFNSLYLLLPMLSAISDLSLTLGKDFKIFKAFLEWRVLNVL
jgi:hypothetical protein